MCSCEINLGALGDLCRRSPALCLKQGPSVSRAPRGPDVGGRCALSWPRAALDHRAHEAEGVGPLSEWLVQLLGSAVWNEEEKDPKKSLGSSQKFR